MVIGMAALGTWVVLYWVVSWVRLIFNDPTNDWWFDEKIWKANSNTQGLENPRGKMLYDLEHRLLTKGMPRKQVFLLLGKPNGHMDSTQFVYHAGYSGMLMPDLNQLFVEFDQHGRLEKSYLVRE